MGSIYGHIPAGGGDWVSTSRYVSFSVFLLRTSLLVLLGSQLKHSPWWLDHLWPYVLCGPTPALPPLLLSPEMQPHPFLNAGRPSVPTTLMFALPLGHLISLQAWVLSLSSLTNLHSHPVKTTETFKGFPMPHWGFRHLPPSKAWCRSYSMVPTPWWCGEFSDSCIDTAEVQEGQQSFRWLSTLATSRGILSTAPHTGELSAGALQVAVPHDVFTPLPSNGDPFSLQLGGSVLTLRSRHIVLCPFLAPFNYTRLSPASASS